MLEWGIRWPILLDQIALAWLIDLHLLLEVVCLRLTIFLNVDAGDNFLWDVSGSLNVFFFFFSFLLRIFRFK